MKNKLLIGLLFIGTLNIITGQDANMIVEGTALLNGNVGIGATSIGENELSIHDIDNDGDVLIDFLGPGRRCILGINPSSDMFFGTVTDHDLAFRTDNTTRMILTPAGNFGIGTPGPNARLHVREDGDIPNENQTVLVLESQVSKRPTLLFSEGGSAFSSGMSVGYDGSGSGTSNKLNILNSIGAEVVSFTSGGNMGVGEPLPSDALTIDGDLGVDPNNNLIYYDGSTVVGTIVFDTQDLRLDQNGSGKSLFMNTPDDVIITGGDDILLNAGDDVIFRTDGNTIMVFDQNGYIGINDITPNAILDVTNPGDGATHSLRMENDSSTDTWDMNVAEISLDLYANGIYRGFFSTNGNYVGLSDLRLKKNINPLHTGALNRLDKLEAKQYYFKQDPKREEKSIGFIAQDVLEVLPSVVALPENEDAYYALSYSQLSVHAIQAIQEQQALIEALKLELKDKLRLKEHVDSNLKLAQNLESKLLNLKQEETLTSETKK